MRAGFFTFMALSLAHVAWAQPPVPKDPTPPEKLSDWKEPAPEAAPAPGEKKIVVSQFRVTGNTLLSDEELRKLCAIYEGKELTLPQLKDVARNLTALYQRNGYFLVRAYVPAQNIQANQVELRVVEGKIGEVTVEGAENYSSEYIRERFLQSFAGETFRSDRFQRTMLLLNELPDLQVKAVMTAGKAEGTADINLRVEDQSPVHFGVDYNNYGTPETGENRVGLSFDAGNVLQQADLLSLRGVVGFPAKQNSFYQLNYQTPLNQDGTALTFGYANGAFTVSQGLGAILDVRGDANIYTMALTHALDRELQFSSNVGLALSHKYIRNNFFGGQVPFSLDEYNSARFSYQADWRAMSGRRGIVATNLVAP